MEVAVSTAPVSKECRMNLRTTRRKREIIESAAELAGQNLTDFIIDSAYDKAEQLLAEQRHFELPADQWTAFLAALDRPTSVPTRLAKLISEPSILER
jgi:uncharacterized protein (DUF1778 family)